MQHDELFRRIREHDGDLCKLAQALGENRRTVWKWNLRKAFPARVWTDVAAYAKRCGIKITADELKKTHRLYGAQHGKAAAD